jgi:hypothetical protein
MASARHIPKYLRAFRLRLKRLILLPKRANRSYPRAVKMSNYLAIAAHRRKSLFSDRHSD